MFVITTCINDIVSCVYSVGGDSASSTPVLGIVFGTLCVVLALALITVLVVFRKSIFNKKSVKTQEKQGTRIV